MTGNTNISIDVPTTPISVLSRPAESSDAEDFSLNKRQLFITTPLTPRLSAYTPVIPTYDQDGDLYYKPDGTMRIGDVNMSLDNVGDSRSCFKESYILDKSPPTSSIFQSLVDRRPADFEFHIKPDEEGGDSILWKGTIHPAITITFDSDITYQGMDEIRYRLIQCILKISPEAVLISRQTSQALTGEESTFRTTGFLQVHPLSGMNIDSTRLWFCQDVEVKFDQRWDSIIQDVLQTRKEVHTVGRVSMNENKFGINPPTTEREIDLWLGTASWHMGSFPVELSRDDGLTLETGLITLEGFEDPIQGGDGKSRIDYYSFVRVSGDDAETGTQMTGMTEATLEDD